MQNQGDYLNEDFYRNANQKIKLVGIIILIVGLCMIGFGAYTLITKNSGKTSSEVPEVVSDSPLGDFAIDSWNSTANSMNAWYTQETDSMKTEFLGVALCMFGVFISIVGCIVRFVIPNLRYIAAYSAQQMRPIVQEGVEKMSPSAGVMAEEITKGVRRAKNAEQTSEETDSWE